MYCNASSLPDGDPNKPRVLQATGDQAMRKYRQTNKAEDLRLALDAYQAAVQHTPILTGTPEQAQLLNSLAEALRIRGGNSE